jgi:hypothetical protein
VTIVAPHTSRSTVPDAEALFREAKRRQHRRRVGWALAVAIVVTVAGLVASQIGSPRVVPHRRTVARPGSGLPVGTPAAIVGWTSRAGVVVISTKTGRVERTLATNISIFEPGIPNVSVSPDGTVFFESAEPAPHNHNVDTGDQIFAVPIAGGPIRDIASGSDPQVSPNGRLLAYIAPGPAGQAGEAPYLVPPIGINVATLSAGGAITGVRTLAPGPLQVNQGASDLAWSGDSRALSFDLLNGSTDVTTSWTVPVESSDDSLAQASEIQLHQAGLTWNGYWGPVLHGRTLGLGVLTSTSGSQEIVTINPRTGREVGSLFKVPAAVCTAVDPAGGDACSSDFSNEVIGDSAGTGVLVAGAIPLVDGSPTTSGRAFLYRWTAGSRSPVRLARQILVAAWGPTASR